MPSTLLTCSSFTKMQWVCLTSSRPWKKHRRKQSTLSSPSWTSSWPRMLPPPCSNWEITGRRLMKGKDATRPWKPGLNGSRPNWPRTPGASTANARVLRKNRSAELPTWLRPRPHMMWWVPLQGHWITWHLQQQVTRSQSNNWCCWISHSQHWWQHSRPPTRISPKR